jgi:hypothetical protein
MLTTQYLPSLIHGTCENGNKELTMSEAIVNIGVFNDNRAAFDFGIKMWRGRAPAAIYLKTDGPAPREAAGCGLAIWETKASRRSSSTDWNRKRPAIPSTRPWRLRANRLRNNLPKIAVVIAGNRPTGVNHHMNWETLTHREMGSAGLTPAEEMRTPGSRWS